MALSNIQKIVQREENDKIRALYGEGNYCLSPEYPKFHVASHVWHSWSEERKTDHLRKFREYGPSCQVFPIHFVYQLMLVENPATNKGTGTQQSQILW